MLTHDFFFLPRGDCMAFHSQEWKKLRQHTSHWSGLSYNTTFQGSLWAPVNALQDSSGSSLCLPLMSQTCLHIAHSMSINQHAITQGEHKTHSPCIRKEWLKVEQIKSDILAYNQNPPKQDIFLEFCFFSPTDYTDLSNLVPEYPPVCFTAPVH